MGFRRASFGGDIIIPLVDIVTESMRSSRRDAACEETRWSIWRVDTRGGWSLAQSQSCFHADYILARDSFHCGLFVDDWVKHALSER